MLQLNEITVSKYSEIYNKYNISAIYGIYLNNELVYVGSSKQCMLRFCQHKRKIIMDESKRCGWKDYTLVYNTLRQAYSNGDNISFDIIDKESDPALLKMLERAYLRVLKPRLNVKDY